LEAAGNGTATTQPSATALWYVAPGVADLRPAAAGDASGAEAVAIRTLWSALSRGTERLVAAGLVPPSEHVRMRAPLQDGDFPFPVKYGYAMVGEVVGGASDYVGKRVIALYPHQSLFNLPLGAVVEVPASIPGERAVLAPQMETALNATWDAAARFGDRIAVVGGGVIGLLTAYLCARAKGVEVTLIDANPSRRVQAEALGLKFATPLDDLPEKCSIVFHASNTAAGLNLALSLAGFEATVIELSWFGDTPVPVNLGGAFHSQRLTLRASQVGAVALSRRARWDFRRRLTKALSLCADPRLDALVARKTPLNKIVRRLPAILSDPETLCHLIQYQES
jgi:hypothetical protein